MPARTGQDGMKSCNYLIKPLKCLKISDRLQKIMQILNAETKKLENAGSHRPGTLSGS